MEIIASDHHRLHATSDLIIDGCPFLTEEVPVRAEIILQAVLEAKLGPVHAPVDHGIEPILAVHNEGLVTYLRTIFAQGSDILGEKTPILPGTFAPRKIRRTSTDFYGLKGYYCFGMDSPILEGTWQAAYWSAQCALSGADHLQAGDRAVYALCRPPGHHAAADLYGGFCYLNNAAIAARFLGGGTAILDIDFHHGNGTQEIFYADPTVFFCSLHAHPDEDYPYYWGAAEETGEGPGTGMNRNWPLPLGTGEAAYLHALDEALEAIAGFAPRVLVISAGFDTAEGDPVGGFRITPNGFREIGRRIAALGLPTLIVQEGGYLLERLGENSVAFLGQFK